MKSFPKFDGQSAVSSIKNPDVDLMSHDQLEDLDKDIEKKLAKQMQQINSNVDKEFTSINTIYAGAIDNALMQVSDYFASIQLEENDKDMAQFTIQKPPKISTPSDSSAREINYNLILARDYQISVSKRIKEEREKNEDLKRKLHI